MSKPCESRSSLFCAKAENLVSLRRERLPGKMLALFRNQSRNKEMYAVAARIWLNGVPLLHAIKIAEEAYQESE